MERLFSGYINAQLDTYLKILQEKDVNKSESYNHFPLRGIDSGRDIGIRSIMVSVSRFPLSLTFCGWKADAGLIMIWTANRIGEEER